MAEEEWRGAISVGSASEFRDTIFGQAYLAWKDWNPEWVLNRLESDSLFTSDEMLRCFMEAYVQGVEKKLGGSND